MTIEHIGNYLSFFKLSKSFFEKLMLLEIN